MIMSLLSKATLSSLASWAEVAAVLFTSLGAFSGIVYVASTRPLRRFEAAEKSALEANVAHANERAEEANKEFALANERTAKLEKETAELNNKNLLLEAAIAPRRLSDGQRKDLASLSSFANRVVGIRSYSADTEGLILATQIAEALRKSKILIEDNRATMHPSGSMSFGVVVEGPDRELVNALTKVLSKNGKLTASSSIKADHGGVSMTLGIGVMRFRTRPAAIVTVGPKPIK